MVPDPAKPLYRWRLTDDEADRAKVILSNYVAAGRSIGNSVAAVFCLYAARALQRGYGPDARSWEIVNEALGQTLPQNDLRDITRTGLARLRRPLRVVEGGTQYFRTLILEGGIPAALIAVDRGQFGGYLSRLQSDFDVLGLNDVAAAERLAVDRLYLLPPAWRKNDIAAIAADLLLAIKPLRDSLPQNHPASQAARWLDEHRPEWRSGLPLPLENENAEKLLVRLIGERRAARSTAPSYTDRLCRRGLRRINGEWHLGVSLAADALIRATELSAPDFTSGEPGKRFRLSADGIEEDIAQRPFAVLEYQNDRDGVAVWRFIPLSADWMPCPSDRPMACRLSRNRDDVGRLELSGGEPLPVELPWVLLDADADTSEPERLVFATAGGLVTRNARLFLAVDPSAGTLDLRTGKQSDAGPILGTNRRIICLEGSAIWHDDSSGTRLQLRSASSSEDVVRLVVRPRRPEWIVDAPVASLGVPELRIDRPKAGYAIHWRSGTSHAWRVLSKGQTLPSGRVDFAILGQDNFVLDQQRVLLLPDNLSLRARLNAGGIVVDCDGLSPNTVSVSTAGLWEQSVTDKGCRLVGGPASLPPSELEVVTRLPEGAIFGVRHRVRVRGLRAALVDAELRPISRNTSLVAEDLRRVSARSAGDGSGAEIVGSVSFGNHHPAGARIVSLRRGFIDVRPLRHMRRELLGLLGLAGSLDANLWLEVTAGGLSDGRIAFRYFGLQVDIDAADETCRITKPTGIVDEALCAWPLHRPDDAPTGLKSAGSGRWGLPSDGQPGIWLIAGAAGLTGRVRPRIWYSSRSGVVDGRLAGAVAIVNAIDRRRHIVTVLQQMAADPWAHHDAVDWQFLEGLLAALQDRVPLMSVDAIRLLAVVPDVWVGMLFRCRDDALADVSRIEEELPLVVATIPIGRWLDIARACRTNLSVLDDKLFNEWMSQRLQMISDRLPQTAGACWYLREKLGLEHAHKDGEAPFTVTQSPVVQRMLSDGVGSTLQPGEWRTEIENSNDWGNLSAAIAATAPVIAAKASIDGTETSPAETAALRFMRDMAPEDFDRRYRWAFQLQLSRKPALP